MLINGKLSIAPPILPDDVEFVHMNTSTLTDNKPTPYITTKTVAYIFALVIDSVTIYHNDSPHSRALIQRGNECPFVHAILMRATHASGDTAAGVHMHVMHNMRFYSNPLAPQAPVRVLEHFLKLHNTTLIVLPKMNLLGPT